METAITNFRNDVKILREQIENYLISLLESHNVKEVDCFGFDDCPIIIDGVSFDDSYSCFTLDSICLLLNHNGKAFITFDCSNHCSSDSLDLNNLGIDLLIEVYEWVKANEEELFEDVE